MVIFNVDYINSSYILNACIIIEITRPGDLAMAVSDSKRPSLTLLRIMCRRWGGSDGGS